TGDGADIDDASATPLAHLRDDRLHAPEFSLHIDTIEAVELGVGDRLDLGQADNACVIDENVDTAEIVRRFVYDVEDRLSVGDVELEGSRPAALILDRPGCG